MPAGSPAKLQAGVSEHASVAGPQPLGRRIRVEPAAPRDPVGELTDERYNKLEGILRGPSYILWHRTAHVLRPDTVPRSRAPKHARTLTRTSRRAVRMAAKHVALVYYTRTSEINRDAGYSVHRALRRVSGRPA